jgi:hypothetical protein
VEQATLVAGPQRGLCEAATLGSSEHEAHAAVALVDVACGRCQQQDTSSDILGPQTAARAARADRAGQRTGGPGARGGRRAQSTN